MSADLDARGLKRICTECGIRFYDMNKRPIICPNCEAEYTGIEKVKSRRSRSALDNAVENVPENVEDDEEETKTKVKQSQTDEIEEDEIEEDEIDLESDVISLDDAKDIENGTDDDDGDSLVPDLDDDPDLDDLDDIDTDIDDDDDDDDLDDVDLDIKIDKDDL